MIEGMEWQEMDSLMKLPECRDRIDSRMKELHKIQSGSTEKDLKKAHSEVLQELSELIELTGEAADLSIKLMISEDSSENQVLLNELNNIDSAILNRESREMAGFILAPILEEHMTRKAVNRSEVLENSKTLYNELRENLIFHKEKIARIIL